LIFTCSMFDDSNFKHSLYKWILQKPHLKKELGPFTLYKWIEY
jgi:hypothetical protein